VRRLVPGVLKMLNETTGATKYFIGSTALHKSALARSRARGSLGPGSGGGGPTANRTSPPASRGRRTRSGTATRLQLIFQ
jgi:hypothetical protein